MTQYRFRRGVEFWLNFANPAWPTNTCAIRSFSTEGPPSTSFIFLYRFLQTFAIFAIFAIFVHFWTSILGDKLLLNFSAKF